MKQNRRGCGGTITFFIVAFAILAVCGVIFMAFLAPAHQTMPQLRNIESPKALKEKLLDWMPSHHAHNVLDEGEDVPPDYSKEFWTPIDVEVDQDPIVILCKLNFKKYGENPHTYPMFKDLEGISKCIGSNRRRERMSVLLKELTDSKATVVKPAGFVFHESRVGSTLIANFLASDPYSLVFSESTPMANALLHCTSCSESQQVQMFRDVATLMGNSPIHKRLFFKFQSITTTKMEIALKAFPDTPWAFVYREPVQTMMSHLDPKKGSNAAPCLRSKRSPPVQVSEALKSKVSGKPPNEAWCAAHLNMLCGFALQAYEKYGKRVSESGESVQRALLINYESLPGSVPRALLPLFGVNLNQHWLNKIQSESQQYSKSRGVSYRIFSGDSKDKTERATDQIQKYAGLLLSDSYTKLNEKAMDCYSTRFPQLLSEGFEWKQLSPIPDTVRSLRTIGLPLEDNEQAKNDAKHSAVLPVKEFHPWLPFANHHSSLPFETVSCPLTPSANYPFTYNLPKILGNWNADSAEIPDRHYDSLCHFDLQNATQLQQAYYYRKAEVPFIAYNIPELDKAVKNWNDFDYLSERLGHKKYRTETSKTNHFMYWRKALAGSANFLQSTKGKEWSEPTSVANMKFHDWLEMAVKGQNKSLEDITHKYFRVSTSAEGNDWLYNELPFFQPKESLFVVDPAEQKGIHCRFGMKSLIAEAHFDGSRNSVVMLGGLRRWILAHPSQCPHMDIMPYDHPSSRHSAVDWSAPDLIQHPNFTKVVANEVILQPGDFLYVPTNWIHYVVSLNVNFQCNSRSGHDGKYDEFVRSCGY